jgi:hypothetical protein
VRLEDYKGQASCFELQVVNDKTASRAQTEHLEADRVDFLDTDGDLISFRTVATRSWWGKEGSKLAMFVNEQLTDDHVQRLRYEAVPAGVGVAVVASVGYEATLYDSKDGLMRLSAALVSGGAVIAQLTRLALANGTEWVEESAPPPVIITAGSQMCPDGCALSCFVTPTAGFKCDDCQAVLPTSTTMWGCRGHDYDRCSECAAAQHALR